MQIRHPYSLLEKLPDALLAEVWPHLNADQAQTIRSSGPRMQKRLEKLAIQTLWEHLPNLLLDMLTGQKTSNYHFLLKWILNDTETNSTEEIKTLRDAIYAQLLVEENTEKPNLLYMAILCRQPTTTISDLLSEQPDLLYGQDKKNKPYDGDPLTLAILQNDVAYCNILLNAELQNRRNIKPHHRYEVIRGYYYYQHDLLKLAIENQNLAIVTALLTTIIDIESKGCVLEEKISELFLLAVELAAMPGGNIDIVNALLNAHKIFVDRSLKKNDREVLPLNLAIKWGNDLLVSMLLTQGFDPNGITKPFGEKSTLTPPALPPIHVAIENGYTAIVAKLLDYGADVNQCSSQQSKPCPSVNTLHNDNTALHKALILGNESIIELLLKQHVDGYAKNADGITPLDILRANPYLRKYETDLLEKTLQHHLKKTNEANSKVGLFHQTKSKRAESNAWHALSRVVIDKADVTDLYSYRTILQENPMLNTIYKDMLKAGMIIRETSPSIEIAALRI